MKPKLKAPGTKRLTLNCDEPPLSFASKCNSRRYNADKEASAASARESMKVAMAAGRDLAEVRPSGICRH
jgi:hypothetical protein